MRIASWNVNGIRAIAKKDDFHHYLKGPDSPDIIGFQETKVSSDMIPKELLEHPDYYSFWNSAEKKGYSGTAIFSKIPSQCTYINYPHPTFEHEFHNTEGRVIGADFGSFMYFTIYFPNGGKSPEHFKYKFLFYKSLFEYFESLRKEGKSLVIAGDYNIAHTELDIARPKENETSIGFTKEERELMDWVESLGYIDTFREFCKEGDHYTWWHYFTKSRERNIGWRIDYIYITPDLRPKLKNARILNNYFGSDHCPIEIELECPEDSLRASHVVSHTPAENTLF